MSLRTKRICNMLIRRWRLKPLLFLAMTESKGLYSQVGFSYDGDRKDEVHFSNGEDEDFNSDDSNDEVMESIAKDYGVKRYGWLVYMDKKAKEEERRQREVIKGDSATEAESQREKEGLSIRKGEGKRSSPCYRESRLSPTYKAYSRYRSLHRSRSRSLSCSPPRSRHYEHGGKSDDISQGKERTPKIESIT